MIFFCFGSDGRADGRTGGRADGRTDKRKDGRTNGRTEGRTDGRTHTLLLVLFLLLLLLLSSSSRVASRCYTVCSCSTMVAMHDVALLCQFAFSQYVIPTYFLTLPNSVREEMFGITLLCNLFMLDSLLVCCRSSHGLSLPFSFIFV